MIPAAPVRLSSLSRAPSLTWNVPGSKSITNRALVLAALAEGTSRLEGVLQSDDTHHMRSALEALGVSITQVNATTLEVTGGRSRLRAPRDALFIGNSGTSVRFLAAVSALVDGPVTLAGDEHMAKRPIADLVDALRSLGVKVDCPTGCPPITVHGGRLSGGRVAMRGDRSSQYFSALLLVGALADADLDLEIGGALVSRPYVEITRRMVADFGGSIDLTAEGFHVHARRPYAARSYGIEPDASSASYAFALGAGSGGSVTVPGLGVGALQGDYAFVELLELAGARVDRTPTLTTVTGTGTLRGLDADLHHISDTVMTLAALAVVSTGPTTIRNVGNIRIKETDRLAATVAELERLGQMVTSGQDWLRIEPRPLRPAVVECYSDHRMAMAFAVLGLLREGVQIADPACVSKTYPGFWDDLGRVYASVGERTPW